MIAAADRRGGIGKNGGLLVSIPSDMKYFREKTTGGTVIMGRKTLESFPGGRPLPERKNVIISRTLPEREDCIICRSVEEARSATAGDDPEKVFVIGGGEIYRAMLPFCEEALITEIDADLNADTFIPVLSGDPEWERISISEPLEENGVRYAFAVYRRLKHESL